MKTNLLIQALFAICATQVHAAEKMSAKTPGYELAPQLGVTSFSIAGSDMSSRGGALAGAGVLIPTSIEGLKIETGLHFMETGAKSTYTFFGFEFSKEIAISSLALPVMANYTFSNNEETGRQWYVRGGAYLLQTVGAKSIVFGEETDIKSEVAGNDVLLTAGFGGATKVFDDYRWSYELAYSQGSVDTLKTQSGKSSGLIASTSLVIPL